MVLNVLSEIESYRDSKSTAVVHAVAHYLHALFAVQLQERLMQSRWQCQWQEYVTSSGTNFS